MWRPPHPPPQTPWQALEQPHQPYSAYPAAAHEMLEPHSTFSRYPAMAYLSSAVRQSAMAPMRTFLTATQDEKAAIGADPEMVAALGIGAGLLLLLAAANIAGAYFAGRAMAPTKDQRMTYGLGTAAANALLGPLGFLGAAGYSVSQQRLPMSYELLGLGTAPTLPPPKCDNIYPGWTGECVSPKTGQLLTQEQWDKFGKTDYTKMLLDVLGTSVEAGLFAGIPLGILAYAVAHFVSDEPHAELRWMGRVIAVTLAGGFIFGASEALAGKT